MYLANKISACTINTLSVIKGYYLIIINYKLCMAILAEANSFYINQPHLAFYGFED